MEFTPLSSSNQITINKDRDREEDREGDKQTDRQRERGEGERGGGRGERMQSIMVECTKCVNCFLYEDNPF